MRYYHHDAIGSVVALTNNNAALTDTYSYTAFGEVRERTGTSTQPYQYVGNAYDSTTKLSDFHARATAQPRCSYNNPEARANAESGPIKKMKRVVATASV